MSGQIPHHPSRQSHPAHGAFAGTRGGYGPMSQPARDIPPRRMRPVDNEAHYVREAEASFRAGVQRPDASHGGHGPWDNESGEVLKHLSRLYRE